MNDLSLTTYAFAAVTSGWGTAITAVLMLVQDQEGFIFLNQDTPVVIPLGVLLSLFGATIFTTYKVTRILTQYIKDRRPSDAK